MGVRTSKSLKIFQGCTSGISVHQLRLDNYVRSIPLFFFCLHLSFHKQLILLFLTAGTFAFERPRLTASP
jgi:hypothetical protein